MIKYVILAFLLAGAGNTATLKPPSGRPNWVMPDTLYVDIQDHLAMAKSNGWVRSYGTGHGAKKSYRRPRDSGTLGVIQPCGTPQVFCEDSIYPLAIDESALDADKIYETADMAFTPKCLYLSAPGRCGVAAIKFIGKPSSQLAGASGFFIWESGFGVRSFSGVDAKTGEIAATFSYASGRPLLAKQRRSPE